MNIAARLLAAAEDTLDLRLPIRLRAWGGSEAGAEDAPVLSATGESGMPTSPMEWLS